MGLGLRGLGFRLGVTKKGSGRKGAQRRGLLKRDPQKGSRRKGSPKRGLEERIWLERVRYRVTKGFYNCSIWVSRRVLQSRTLPETHMEPEPYKGSMRVSMLCKV